MIVYLFDASDPDVFISGFDARVPVHIFGGGLEIDLAEVAEMLRRVEDMEGGS